MHIKYTKSLDLYVFLQFLKKSVDKIIQLELYLKKAIVYKYSQVLNKGVDGRLIRNLIVSTNVLFFTDKSRRKHYVLNTGNNIQNN